MFEFLGGNQRDLARAKNQKKLTDLKKGVRTDNLTVEQRKARYVDEYFIYLRKKILFFTIIQTDLLNKFLVPNWFFYRFYYDDDDLFIHQICPKFKFN